MSLVWGFVGSKVANSWHNIINLNLEKNIMDKRNAIKAANEIVLQNNVGQELSLIRRHQTN